MRRYSNELFHILNTFYRTAGVGALCFDERLSLIACRPSNTLANEFACLGTNRITAFIAEKMLPEPENKPVVYTYFLEGNLVSNIVLLAVGGSYIGVLVTQPVFVKKHSAAELEELAAKLASSSKEQVTLKNILIKTPYRPYDSLAAMGETLTSIAQTVFAKKTVPQILCGDLSRTAINEPEPRTENLERVEGADLPVRHLRFSNFIKMKESIQAGNAGALTEVLGELTNGGMPTHQLDRSNYMRSLKDSYIKVCMLGCYAAIEANAPYYKTLDLADELIRQMEKLENAFDVFELMKKTLLEFARAVEVSHIQTHSKPVRQVLDYIHAHYDEKLTLEMLAEQTGLSTFYLSTLIKKETGLMLMDNINAIRVEESKKLLLNKNISIIDVAQQVGFSYQNHYSTVFKKFTGQTPTEYVKSMGTGYEAKTADKSISKAIPIIVEQLRSTLALLPEMYDVARIVEPKSHAAWVVKSVEEDIIPETCYDFWNRNKSCKNCISSLAYLHNRTFMKLDQKGNQVYMVLATPKTIGTNTYIIEVLKNITDDMFINIDLDAYQNNAAHKHSGPADTGGNPAGLRGRKEVDADLPVCVRRSKLEKQPFSVVVLQIDGLNDDERELPPALREDALRQFTTILCEVVGSRECSWAGSYTGDVFIAALGDADYDAASRTAEKICRSFELISFDAGDDIVHFSVSAGVETLCRESGDANTLVNSALLDLNAKILAKQLDSDD